MGSNRSGVCGVNGRSIADVSDVRTSGRKHKDITPRTRELNTDTPRELRHISDMKITNHVANAVGQENCWADL